MPLHESAAKAIRDLLSRGFLGNPSSIHSTGRKAKADLSRARRQVAKSLGPNTDPERIVFTSSGSEANQMVCRLVSGNNRQSSGVEWITTPVEHHSVIDMAKWFKARGGSIRYLSVDTDGKPSVDDLDMLICDETALVSLIWVNNETGVISDVNKASKIIEAANLDRAKRNLPEIKLCIDAAQAWGKLPIDVETLGAHFVTLSAHKIGAPAGTGVIWIKPRTKILPELACITGNQERGRRGGTENLIGIVATGAAAEQIDAEVFTNTVLPLRGWLENEIKTRIEGVTVNGGKSNRVANTINLSFSGVEEDSLIIALDLAGYNVSSGSACSSGVLAPSHVLEAMGLSKKEAMSALRLSLAKTHTKDELLGFVEALETAVGRIRRVAVQHSSKSITTGAQSLDLI
jgi:cysteine desulfurase